MIFIHDINTNEICIAPQVVATNAVSIDEPVSDSVWWKDKLNNVTTKIELSGKTFSCLCHPCTLGNSSFLTEDWLSENSIKDSLARTPVCQMVSYTSIGSIKTAAAFNTLKYLVEPTVNEYCNY